MVTDDEILSQLPFFWIGCLIALINFIMSQNVHLHGSDFFLKGTKWLHADLIPA